MATKSKVKTTATQKAVVSSKKDAGEKSTKQAFAAAKPSGADGKTKASAKGAAAEKPSEELDKDGRPKRALGLRGAAPWAARHAAKHAAEARKRAAEPPPPGSARATIRTPTGVEDIKAKIVELHNDLERVRGMRKNVNKSFYDIGTILREIQARKLYSAKGFQSFEAFVEREVDLGKTVAMRLVKLVGIFQKDAALEMGMDKAMEALIHLEGGPEQSNKPQSESRMPAAKPQSSVNKAPIVR